VHRSPETYYPHFAGYKEETGGPSAPNGVLNVSLPAQAGDASFVSGIENCVAAVLEHRPGALVVSLGFDALLTDPCNGLSVSEPAFEKLGSLSAPSTNQSYSSRKADTILSISKTWRKGFCVASARPRGWIAIPVRSR